MDHAVRGFHIGGCDFCSDPDPTTGQAYIDVLAENGWNDYFATESVRGDPKTPFGVMTQHVLL